MFKPLVVLGCLLLASTASYAEEYFEPIVKEERVVLKKLFKEIGFKETDIRVYKTTSDIKFNEENYRFYSQVLYRKKIENHYVWSESKKKQRYSSISWLPSYPNIVINNNGNIVSVTIKKNKISFENSQYLSSFKELLAFRLSSKNGCNKKTVNNFKKTNLKSLLLNCNESLSFPDLNQFPELLSLSIKNVEMEKKAIPEKNSLKSLYVTVKKNIENLKELKSLSHLTSLRLSFKELPKEDPVDFNWFTNMKELEKLKISGSTTVNNISSLGSLKQLKSLSLILHSVQSLDGLSDLSELESIKLYMHQLKTLPSLSHMTKLKLLGIDGTKLSSLEFVSDTTSLIDFDLYQAPIKSMKPVGSLVNLEVLELGRTSIKKIEGLNDLKKLKILEITESPVKKIEGLDGLISLESLVLSETNIKKMENLDNLINLETIFPPRFNRTKENFQYMKKLENKGVDIIY